MAKEKGWVKLERAILDTVVWSNTEPFDERSAYVDLVLRANYEDKAFRPRRETTIINVKAGQFFTSIAKLCERWKWSENKVRRYLKMLKNLGFIRTDARACGTLITLENIGGEGFGARTNEGTSEGTREGTRGGTSEGTGGRRLKKDKNSKESKEPKKRAQRGLNPWEGDPE